LRIGRVANYEGRQAFWHVKYPSAVGPRHSWSNHSHYDRRLHLFVTIPTASLSRSNVS
jgi:hypothetical protein